MLQKNVVNRELFDKKTFFTLGGTSLAVWLLCLVISNFDPQAKIFTPTHYRFIALTISFVLAILIVVKEKNKSKIEDWIIAFFNALLIFVNASGLNAISSKLTFENINTIEQRKIDIGEVQKASLFNLQLNTNFFKNQVQWWVDDEYFLEKKKVEVENEILKKKIKFLEQKKYKNKENEDFFTPKDSLKIIIKKLKDSILEINNNKPHSKKNIESYNNCVDRLEKISKSLDSIKKSNKNLRYNLRNMGLLNRKIDSLNLKIRDLEKFIKFNNYDILIVRIDRLRNELVKCKTRFDQN